MIYIAIVLQYLDRHIWAVVIAMGALYSCYIAINMILSPYLLHNNAIRRSIAQLRHTVSTGKLVPFVTSIPAQYRAQWHCYSTAHSVPAVSMFTPLEHNSSRRAVFLLICSHAIAMLCLCISLAYSTNAVAMYAVGVYVAIMFPVHILLRWMSSRQYRQACRYFGRWVALVQAYFGMGDTAAAKPAKSSDIEDMIEQLKLIKNCEKEEVASKVATIINSQPRDVERTVAQQRRINSVLNELLVIGG